LGETTKDTKQKKEANPIGFLAGDGFTWRVKSPDDEIHFVCFVCFVVSTALFKLIFSAVSEK
jgi:hypothetical protein